MLGLLHMLHMCGTRALQCRSNAKNLLRAASCAGVPMLRLQKYTERLEIVLMQH